MQKVKSVSCSLFILRFFISVLFNYSCKITKKWQKWGGQKAKYSVKGGFSADFMYKKVKKVLKLCRKNIYLYPKWHKYVFSHLQLPFCNDNYKPA